LTGSARPATIVSFYAALAPEGECFFGHITVEPIVDDTIAVVVEAVTELISWKTGCGTAFCPSLIPGTLIGSVTPALADPHGTRLTHVESFINPRVAVIILTVTLLRSSRVDGRIIVITISALFATR
jgi:hypothetical protein